MKKKILVSILAAGLVSGYNVASAVDKTVYGTGATASGANSCAVGYNAKALGKCGLAYGYYAWTYGCIGTALGAYAYSYNSLFQVSTDSGHGYTTAVGTASYAVGDFSVAIGAGAASSSYSEIAGTSSDTRSGATTGVDAIAGIAIGSAVYPYETSTYTYEIDGTEYTATYGYYTDLSEATLSAATITAAFGTAIGSGSSVSAANSVALGTAATASGTYASVIGYSASVSGSSSIAIGATASVTADSSTAVGYGAAVATANSVAVGAETAITTTSEDESASNAVAVGYQASVTVEDGIALGSGSVASTASGVSGIVFGSTSTMTSDLYTSAAWTATGGAISVGDIVYSGTTVTTTANEDGTISVSVSQGESSGSLTRQITGVAAGTNDTDLANVAQLKQVLEVVDEVQEEATSAKSLATAAAESASDAAEQAEAATKEVEVVAATATAAGEAATAAAASAEEANIVMGNLLAAVNAIVAQISDWSESESDGSTTYKYEDGYNFKAENSIAVAITQLDTALGDRSAWDSGTLINSEMSYAEAVAAIDEALGVALVKYDTGEDGVVGSNKNSITLEGDSYSAADGVYSGGTSISNVAYAEKDTDSTGYDGSALVNVDLLNDAVLDNNNELVGAYSDTAGGTFAAFDSGLSVVTSGMTVSEAVAALDYAMGVSLLHYDDVTTHDSVTLAGETYEDGANGTSLTNVAYAEADEEEDGYDASALVNVDLLNDSISAYDALLEAEGLTVTAEEGGAASAAITSGAVTAATEAGEASLTSSALSLTEGSAATEIAAGSATLEGDGGSVTLSADKAELTVSSSDSPDASVTIGSAAAYGLTAFSKKDLYYDEEDTYSSYAVSAATLRTIVGEASDLLVEAISAASAASADTSSSSSKARAKVAASSDTAATTTVVDALNTLYANYVVVDAYAVHYDTDANNSVTLAGEDYGASEGDDGKTAYSGGTALTNVAYAVASASAEDYDGSAAVNVDLLNDELASYNEQLESEGLTVTDEEQTASLTSAGVSVTTYDSDGETALSEASVTSGSVTLAGDYAVSADAASGAVTVSSEDGSVALSSSSVTGLDTLDDIYAGSLDTTTAVSVGTLTGIIGTTAEINTDLLNTDGSSTTMVDAINNLLVSVEELNSQSSVLYDTTENEDGEEETDYASVTLGNGQADSYDGQTREGGVSLTNVAYAETDEEEDGYDASALVNVALLNDTVAAYKARLETYGFTVTAGDGSESYAALAASGVTVAAEAEDTEETAELTASGLTLSASANGENTAATSVASGVITVSSVAAGEGNETESALTITSSAVSGLSSLTQEEYIAVATGEDTAYETLSSAVSVETLANVVGDLVYVTEEALAAGETAYVTNGVDVTTAIGEINAALQNLSASGLTVADDDGTTEVAGDGVTVSSETSSDETTTTTNEDGSTESTRNTTSSTSESYQGSDSIGVDTATTSSSTTTTTGADGSSATETTTTATAASSELTGSSLSLEKSVTTVVSDGSDVSSASTTIYSNYAAVDEITLSTDYGDGETEATTLRASGVKAYSAADGAVYGAELTGSALKITAEDGDTSASASLDGGALALGYQDAATGEAGAISASPAGGITIASEKSGAVSSATLTAGSLTIDDKTYITSEGINANSQRITNVAEGTTYTDLATVGQLNRMDASLSRRINKVGAGAAALASLHPLDYDEDDKLNLAAGLGYYHGETAGAMGVFYQANERIAGNFSTTVGNDQNMVNFGIYFALDRVVGGSGQSRAALERTVADLLKENRQLAGEIAAAAREHEEAAAVNRQLAERAASLENTVRRLSQVVMALAAQGETP